MQSTCPRATGHRVKAGHMRLTNVGAALNRLRRCATRCADPVWTKPCGQGGRAPHRHPPSWLSPLHSPGCSWPLPRPAMTWLPLNVVIVDNDRGVTARAHIARGCLGLVLQSCLRVPLECMQGGSHWPGPAVEPERAQWHDPVLGRWLGLTPERPALSA